MNISATPYINRNYMYVRNMQVNPAPTVNGSSTQPLSPQNNLRSGSTGPDTISNTKKSSGDNDLYLRNKISANQESEYSSGSQTVSAQNEENKNRDGVDPTQESEKSSENKSENSISQGSEKENELSEDELLELQKLEKSDKEVRTHEMAHIAAGGQYITSGARLEYRKGPDGKSYAVAGEVSIDTSPVSNDPEATVEKMRQVQRAALAPASPSSQDRKVAANAGSMAAKAMSELITSQNEKRTEQDDNTAFGDMRKKAADTYSKVGSMDSDRQNYSFSIAV